MNVWDLSATYFQVEISRKPIELRARTDSGCRWTIDAISYWLLIDLDLEDRFNSVKELRDCFINAYAQKKGKGSLKYNLHCCISRLLFYISRIRVYRWVDGKYFDIWIISSNVNLMDLPEVKLMLLRYVQQTRRNFPRL